ncbi:hypothetical protein [Candidatus Harpocratesius sp.]
MSENNLLNMIFYGDHFIEISGYIESIGNNFIKIRIENSKRYIFIPIFFLKNNEVIKVGDFNKIFVPEWFVRKQRIKKLGKIT